MKIDVHNFHRHRGILVNIVSYEGFVNNDSIRGRTFFAEYSDRKEVGEPNTANRIPRPCWLAESIRAPKWSGSCVRAESRCHDGRDVVCYGLQKLRL